MIIDILSAINIIVNGIRINSIFVLTLLGVLWGIYFVNRFLLKNIFCVLGIFPRTSHGIIGIIFAPFLHENFDHILFNSLPLFLLVNLLLITYTKPEFYLISTYIMLLAGVLIWLFGRRGIHIGSSYMVMGYFGFLLSQAYFQRNIMSIGLVILVFYYFGGLIFSIIPTKDRVSWEGHLLGLIAGIAVYWVMLRFGIRLI